MRRRSFRLGAAVSLALLVAPASVPAQEIVSAADGDAEQGRSLYLQYCQGCHGRDGRGGAHTFMPHVHTLTQKGYIELVPDDYLYTVIAEGGPAVGKSAYMPAWNAVLSDEDITDLIAHIRSFSLH